MSVRDWHASALSSVKQASILREKAGRLNTAIVQQIGSTGARLGKQWLHTHEVASKQVEAALATQSSLIGTQSEASRLICSSSFLLDENSK